MGKRIVFGVAAVLLVVAAAYANFFIAPTERPMGKRRTLLEQLSALSPGKRLHEI